MIATVLTSPCLVYIACTVVVLYLLRKWLRSSYNLEDKFGFRGPKPLPLFGNSLEFMKHGFHVRDAANQKKYGHIYPIYFGSLGMMVVSDEVLLKQILVKDARSFIDRPANRITSKLMKKNLLQLKGKDWERVRALVTPTFTSGKLKKMSPMIVASVNDMINRFESVSHENIDVKMIFGSLTMDVIAKTMFGIDINLSDSSSNVFINHARKLFNFSFSNYFFLFTSMFPSTLKIVEKFYPHGISSPESMQFLAKSIAKTIESRKNSTEEYHDFLSLMLNAHNELEKQRSDSNSAGENVHKGLTEEEIMAQSIVFLLAGYETTASTLTFCTYYLAKHLDVQEEVYQELVENISDKKEITYDVLSELNLIEQCLQETLRICPPTPRFFRLCTSDTTLISSKGQIIQAKKGMNFAIPVYAIHHDERHWQEPENFDIHRFDASAKQSRSPFAYMPFGSGPRMCVGMRFALLEAKLALAHLLKNYKILPCDQTPAKLIFGTSGLTTVKEPVIIRIEKR